MAQIIDNALVYLKLDRKEATLSFTDVDKISQRFIIAVERNVHDQIVSGYPDGEFKPQKTATRAEAAAFISRMLRKKHLMWNTAKIRYSERATSTRRT